jgi:hypothetical protein
MNHMMLNILITAHSPRLQRLLLLYKITNIRSRILPTSLRLPILKIEAFVPFIILKLY